MASADLTTLATLKEWLPVNSTNTNDDATLTRLLTAVSMDFARATKRPDLLLAEYTEVRQGDGAYRMITYHWPIVAVATLTVGGIAITESEDKIQNGYYFDQDIDPERIWNLYLNGYVFTDGAPVVLGYSAGYVQPGETVGTGQIALPEDIEQAVCDWCAYRYKERPNVTATQRRSTQGESAQTELLDAPPNVLQVIERYKRDLPSIDRRADERAERMTRPGFKSQGKKK
jgi:hypothetical protein